MIVKAQGGVARTVLAAVVIAYTFIGTTDGFFAHAAHDGQDAQATSSGSAPQSVAEGVYSGEQAKRGEATFLDECARCHSETLGGTEFGPAIVGDEFIKMWNGMTVGELFRLIRETMPADGPGRLSAARTADVVAFVLKSNGFPAGQQPLGSDVASLKAIRIENPK